MIRVAKSSIHFKKALFQRLLKIFFRKPPKTVVDVPKELVKPDKLTEIRTQRNVPLLEIKDAYNMINSYKDYMLKQEQKVILYQNLRLLIKLFGYYDVKNQKFIKPSSNLTADELVKKGGELAVEITGNEKIKGAIFMLDYDLSKLEHTKCEIWIKYN